MASMQIMQSNIVAKSFKQGNRVWRKMETYARRMIVKTWIMKRMLVGYVKCANFVGATHTHLAIYISSFVTTLHSAVVAFCAVESNSCIFQVASSSGNLLRSDSEYTRVHALPFHALELPHWCRLTRTRMSICISPLGYCLDKNLVRNRFTPMKRVHYRDLLCASAPEFLSLSLFLS